MVIFRQIWSHWLNRPSAKLKLFSAFVPFSFCVFILFCSYFLFLVFSSLWNLNPRPFEHESSPITTRPGFPPSYFNCYMNVINLDRLTSRSLWSNCSTRSSQSRIPFPEWLMRRIIWWGIMRRSRLIKPCKNL